MVMMIARDSLNTTLDIYTTENMHMKVSDILVNFVISKEKLKED